MCVCVWGTDVFGVTALEAWYARGLTPPHAQHPCECVGRCMSIRGHTVKGSQNASGPGLTVTCESVQGASDSHQRHSNNLDEIETLGCLCRCAPPQVNVNGPDTHPVFEFLKRELPASEGGGGGSGPGTDLVWNFSE